MSNTIEIINFRVINWHAINDSGIIQMNGNTMFCGGSGSGKSTLMDALNATIFINLNCFNKAANQKGSRDTKSYVRYRDRSTDDDGNVLKYKRRGKVISYSVAEFGSKDPNRPGKYMDTFLLGVCYVSRSDTAPIEYHYFAVKGINLKDLKLLNDDKTPVLFEQLWMQMQNCNPVFLKGYNTQHDGERLFASMLGFRGRFEDFVRIKKFIANNMAFDAAKINDVRKFFQEQFLPPRDLRMDNMDELCSNYNKLHDQLLEEEKKSQALNQIKNHVDNIHNIESDIFRNTVLKNIADYNYKIGFIDSKQKESDYKASQIAEYSEQKNAIEIDKTNLVKEEAILEQNDESKQISMYRDRIEQCKKSIAFSARHYDAFVDGINKLNDVVIDINNYFNESFDTFNIDTITFENANMTDLFAYTESIKAVLNQREASMNQELNDLGNKRKKLDEEIDSLKRGNYANQNIKVAMDHIRKHFQQKGIIDEPKMLYQCLNINPEHKEWQRAIEALMGYTRFYLLVDASNYLSVAEIIDKNGYDVTLIDTSDLNEKYYCHENSVCHFLTYSNKYAEQFMRYRYGNHVAVDSCVNIRDKSHSYIGKNRSAYSGKTFFFYKDPRDLVIGEDMINDLRNSKMHERSDIIDEINALSNVLRSINQYKLCVDKATATAHVITKDILHDVEVLPKEIDRLNDEIDALENNPDFLLRTEQLNKCRERIAECKDQLNLIESEILKLSGEKSILDNELLQAKEDLIVLEEQYNKYKNENVDLFNDASIRYEKMCQNKNRTVASIMNACNDENRKLIREKDSLEVELRRYQLEYSKTFDASMPYGGMCDKEVYIKLYKDTNIDGLDNLRKLVEEARIKQLKAFETNVVYELRGAIKTAKRNIAEINRILGSTDYNGKKYRLSNIKPAPGLEHYYDIIMDEDLDVDSEEFTVFSVLNENAINERANLIEFIRANEKYHDYRNFIVMDLDVTLGANSGVKKLSEDIGFFSGGETQIPFYIMMAISMLNLYGSSNEKMLRLNLIDEAFEKMDIVSINEMMRLYKVLGFQTILSAPDSRNEVLGSKVDNSYIMINNEVGRTLMRMPSERKLLSFNKIKAEADNTAEEVA